MIICSVFSAENVRLSPICLEFIGKLGEALRITYQVSEAGFNFECDSSIRGTNGLFGCNGCGLTAYVTVGSYVPLWRGAATSGTPCTPACFLWRGLDRASSVGPLFPILGIRIIRPSGKHSVLRSGHSGHRQTDVLGAHAHQHRRKATRTR